MILQLSRNNMKHLKKYNEMLSYSGGDVTKMPIIGKVITKPIGPFESGEYDIVEIIETEKGPIYVANMWYKEWKRIPQLIHSELVNEWIPISNESIGDLLGMRGDSTGMRREKCDRCGESTKGVTTMSFFNQDVIFQKCKEEERKDPDYTLAVQAESEALRNGDRNYPGLYPNYTPIKRD